MLTNEELAQLIVWDHSEEQMVSLLMDHVPRDEMEQLIPMEPGAEEFYRAALDKATVERLNKAFEPRVTFVQRVAEQVLGEPPIPGPPCAAYERELLARTAEALGLSDG